MSLKNFRALTFALRSSMMFKCLDQECLKTIDQFAASVAQWLTFLLRQSEVTDLLLIDTHPVNGMANFIC